MIGRVYLEKGQPVTILARWEPGRGGPRNVLIQRADGTKVSRPFRGLRRLPDDYVSHDRPGGRDQEVERHLSPSGPVDSETALSHNLCTTNPTAPTGLDARTPAAAERSGQSCNRPEGATRG